MTSMLLIDTGISQYVINTLVTCSHVIAIYRYQWYKRVTVIVYKSFLHSLLTGQHQDYFYCFFVLDLLIELNIIKSTSSTFVIISVNDTTLIMTNLPKL